MLDILLGVYVLSVVIAFVYAVIDIKDGLSFGRNFTVREAVMVFVFTSIPLINILFIVYCCKDIILIKCKDIVLIKGKQNEKTTT